jgi:hypothetical protein
MLGQFLLDPLIDALRRVPLLSRHLPIIFQDPNRWTV